MSAAVVTYVGKVGDFWLGDTLIYRTFVAGD